MFNKNFAQDNKQFRDTCSKVGIPVTTRQASKFLNQKGLAYKFSTGKVKVEKNSEGKFVKIVKQLIN